jgi:hypothetical protein
MPDHIPKVKEIGASSAPLMSASFFIGARCRPYNDDYMQCKTEAYGRGELDCMKEGRKVTRCAASVSVYPCLFLAKQLERAKPNIGEVQKLNIFISHTGWTISIRTASRSFERIGTVWRTITTNCGSVEGRNES